jgi:hypothetical protein
MENVRNLVGILIEGMWKQQCLVMDMKEQAESGGVVDLFARFFSVMYTDVYTLTDATSYYQPHVFLTRYYLTLRLLT